MKTKFFLCLRPPVIETDDGSPYSPALNKISGRRTRDLQQRKRVAAEKYIRQLSIKSNSIRFSGNISETKSENPRQDESQKAQKTCSSVAGTNIPVSFSVKKSDCCQKQSMISNGKVRGGPDLNSGVHLIVSGLFFTIFLGKLFGILCTLILICAVYPPRKNDGNGGRRSESMVVKPPEEYKKRIIMEGLLERKSHNRESIKFLS